MAASVTLGVIVGNRGFFPDWVAREGRKEILALLKKEGIKAVCLSERDTKYGAVETLEDARKCADLFDKNRKAIDGVLVTLPNFGDEKGIANTIKFSGLNVPILMQAYPDDLKKLDMGSRRDAFCGKLSVCNNLLQYGYPFSLTRTHTVDPKSQEFLEDLRNFVATCRVVKGLRNARLGAIGARTGPFNTVRYSEKLLEMTGISVETVDLSEILGLACALTDTDRKVKARLKKIKDYVNTKGTPEEALVKMAKLATVLDGWIKDNAIDGIALQCWTAIEEYFGIQPCTVMSMLGEKLIPSACEVDVSGLVGMYALQLASGKPSALVDWNNNAGTNPDEAIIFHCSNFPISMITSGKVSHHEIICTAVAKEKTYGPCTGHMKPGPMTFCRVATEDVDGDIIAYVTEGEAKKNKLNTFGAHCIVNIPDLQGLLEYACKNGFEHHVAVSYSQTGKAIVEAMETYLGWEVYGHAL